MTDRGWMGDKPASVQRDLEGHLFNDGRAQDRTRADLSQGEGNARGPKPASMLVCGIYDLG